MLATRPGPSADMTSSWTDFGPVSLDSSAPGPKPSDPWVARYRLSPELSATVVMKPRVVSSSNSTCCSCCAGGSSAGFRLPSDDCAEAGLSTHRLAVDWYDLGWPN